MSWIIFMTRAEQAQSSSDPRKQMGKQKTTKIMESEPDGMPNTLWQHRQRLRQVRLREIEACVLG